MDASLGHLLEAEVRRAGFTLYHWTLKPAGRRRILQIFLQSDEGVLLDDCARVSKRVAAAIEEADALAGSYVLEVSSPGLDRPLLKPWHFEAARGERVRVFPRPGAPGGGSILEGVVLGLEGALLRLDCDGEERRLPLDDIHRARVQPEIKVGRSRRDREDGGKA